MIQRGKKTIRIKSEVDSFCCCSDGRNKQQSSKKCGGKLETTLLSFFSNHKKTKKFSGKKKAENPLRLRKKSKCLQRKVWGEREEGMNCVYFVNCLRSINKNINVSSFFIFILFHWLLCLENECLHRCLFCLFFFVLLLQLSVDFHMETSQRRVRSLSTRSSTMKRFALMVIKNFKTTQNRGKKFIAQQNTKMRKHFCENCVYIFFEGCSDGEVCEGFGGISIERFNADKKCLVEN